MTYRIIFKSLEDNHQLKLGGKRIKVVKKQAGRKRKDHLM